MNYKKEEKELKIAEKSGGISESVQIPIGKASVKQMIDAGFYADKTPYINKLFKDDGTYFFFIRPRRFGKSLLLDTIDQIAKGNKALFKGCAIYEDKTYKWEKYPVIWLNFSELAKDNPTELKKSLNRKLYDIAELFELHDKINISVEEACEDYLKRVINLLNKLAGSVF
ncbi:AAA family ATPase [Cardinium endosymbiont of Philonthus spinipes]|uniref:AAA family ATPase n=1 Tax=Cardinium endosymbiont of Philonthus spinipes TaxID=3077941 RepID=UPI00313E636F